MQETTIKSLPVMVYLWIWLAIAVLWNACKVLTGSSLASLFFFLSHTRHVHNIYILKNCSTFFVPVFWERHSSHKSSTTHFYRCWCRNVFPIHAHRCWCMQLHMGDVQTPCVGEPALGEKSPASPGLKPVSVLCLAFFSQMFCQLSHLCWPVLMLNLKF